jgi:ATPase subunit of ABC transporter with duplicated ATPase domains
MNLNNNGCADTIALKTFEGGLLVITHNVEFSESICSTFTVCLHKTDAYAVLQLKSGL